MRLKDLNLRRLSTGHEPKEIKFYFLYVIILRENNDCPFFLFFFTLGCNLSFWNDIIVRHIIIIRTDFFIYYKQHNCLNVYILMH